MGGSSNNAVGRFSFVAGSAQSAADGRKATALGFNATVHGDHSAAFSFNGQGCTIKRGDDNTIRFCANDLLYNGVSVVNGVSGKRVRRRRALQSGGGDDDDSGGTDEHDDADLDAAEEQLRAREAELDEFEALVEEELLQRHQQIERNARVIAAMKKATRE